MKFSFTVMPVTRLFRNTVVGLLLVFSYGVFGSEQEPVVIADETDAREWGIRNNCINLRQIKRVNVVSDEAAYIEVGGGKKVLMTFKGSCRGLKHNGYVHSTRTNNLCAKFDSIRVINSGAICLIESLEPMIELDNEPVTLDEE